MTLISGTLGPADTLLGTLATAAELHAGIRNDYRDSDEHCHARRKIVHAVA